MSTLSDATLVTAPLTPDRWGDLVLVFGKNRGVQCQCWCMYWRLPHAEFVRAQGAKARKLWHARVDAGPPPGLLAYADGEPAGWIQVGPRAAVVPVCSRPVRSTRMSSAIRARSITALRRASAVPALARSRGVVRTGR